MKISYNSLLIMAVAGFGVPAMAQQDSTLTREMTIEKEYNPIVREADKITRMPEVETPQANKTRIVYAEPTLDGKARRELQTLEVGAVNTSYPFSKKRGYLDLSGGNYLNLQGKFGYRFIDKEKDLFGIELMHNSTNGDVKFVDEAWGKTKQKVNDNHANLYYHHRFHNWMLHTNAAYDYSGFNYYGGLGEIETLLPNNQEQGTQKQQRISLNLSGATIRKQEWDYKMSLGFTSFSQKMPGIQENTIALGMGLAKQTCDSWRFAMDLDTRVMVYGGDSQKYDWQTKDAFKNMGNIRLLPAMNYDNGDGLNVKLGIEADFSFGRPPYIGIAPDIELNWKMAEHWLLYGDLTGGIEQYSLSDMAKQNRYYYMEGQPRNSYKIADLQLGIRSNVLAGFWFDLYGSAGYTLDELFEQTYLSTLINGEYYYDTNRLSGFTADGFSWKVGAKLKYKFSDVLDLHLNIQKNGWNLKDDQTASYKPGIEGAFGMTLRPLKKLIFDLSYDFKGDREAVILEERAVVTPDTDPTKAVGNTQFTRQTTSLKDIHQLNLKTTYRFNDTFSVYCSLNNLLFRRQDMWYGMPYQGFHFMAGGSIRF